MPEPTTFKVEDEKLEPGMILLRPDPPTVYAVVSARTLVTHHGDCTETAKLSRSGLPAGWRIVKAAPLAKLLVDKLREHEEQEAREEQERLHGTP